MPAYKLTYFDIRGYAEPIRMMFVVAGQPFEDVRLTAEEWPAVKPKMPFGEVPVLEVDGKMLPQTRAIKYFVAREFKLYGDSNWESAAIDVVGEIVFEIMKPFSEMMSEKDEAIKAEKKKKYEAALPAGFEKLDGELKKNKEGDGFFVGDKISMADITVFAAFEYIEQAGGGVEIEKFPKLKALQARVAADKNMAAYLAKRKPTDF